MSHKMQLFCNQGAERGMDLNSQPKEPRSSLARQNRPAAPRCFLSLQRDDAEHDESTGSGVEDGYTAVRRRRRGAKSSETAADC